MYSDSEVCALGIFAITLALGIGTLLYLPFCSFKNNNAERAKMERQLDLSKKRLARLEQKKALLEQKEASLRHRTAFLKQKRTMADIEVMVMGLGNRAW